MFGPRSDPRGDSKSLQTVPSTPLTNYVCVISGSNAGIGLETARDLYSRGATVILACRSSKANQAIADIIASSQNLNGTGGTLIYKNLDLSSLESARQFAQSHVGKLDLLICNGGAIQLQKTTTKENFELTYVTNYLAHALLTLLLLPSLAKAPAPRIINVSSFGAYNRTINLDNLNAESLPSSPWSIFTSFSRGIEMYAASKLLQVAFTVQLQELLIKSSHDNIVVSAIHPGVVASAITSATHYGFPPFISRFLTWIFSFIGRSVEDGAKTSLWAALAPEAGVGQGGQFWADTRVAELPSGAADPVMNKALFDRTLKDCGLEGWTVEEALKGVIVA